jgi:chromosome segregation ATPase
LGKSGLLTANLEKEYLEQIDSLKLDLEDRADQINLLNDSLNVAREKSEILLNEINGQTDTNHRLQMQIEAQQQMSDRSDKSNLEMRSAIDMLNLQNEELGLKLQEVSGNLRDSEARNSDLTVQYEKTTNNKETKINLLKAEIDGLRDELDSLK